ncbi:S8 family serine peptidase [Neobacillus sp. WH10]|uniref:S8 family serine peptidase n=1 Tax=Neobacillus sp. WH10 TaxID=3047873 RepID=UPI0024C1404C|nr:S8 family serine peptidase [Neobacillus sp. WH10]WHY78558.1 S8 family serine peptidase [Neobacillus sp. WH10]
MKKRKMKAWKVMTTAAMTSLLFTSLTVFAESDDMPAESQMVEEMVEEGGPLFFDKDKIETGQDDSLYKDVKKEGLVEAHKPNDTVRFIVEVEQPTATDLSPKNKKSLFKEKQDKVIEEISKKNRSKSNSPSKVKQRFFESFNGFSIETEFQNIKEIQSIPGVVNVHIARTFQESMAASKELVQAQKVWEQYGYKGEGLVVAVVDSGIDYTHQDMTLTDKAKAKEKLTQSGIKSKLDETAVNDVWYSDKVPTGYDWADDDTDVIPAGNGSSHGTHVAGTIGADGDETNGGIEGIAPGVQLLAEKVFSDKGGGAYEDDIIAGIEHAVTMGADVINMSLGSDAGFVGEENDPIQKAIRVATEQGTLVVVAAGNSAYSTKHNLLFPSAYSPYAENPDIGTVSEPSVGPYALSVASYENTQMHLNTLSETNGLKLPFQDQTQFGKPNFKLSNFLNPNEEYELVFVGEGSKNADFTSNGKNVAGKIVVAKLLNQYTSYSFIQFNAAKFGAKAAIIIPPDSMGDYPYLRLSEFSIPAATTGKAPGQELINKLTNNQIVKMKLAGDTWVDNANKNTMSYFSSIGSPHTLDFKPEISAPGGNIYSTVPGNDYEIMSGTSMAAPHVAGGSALLLQALYQKGLTHSQDTVLKAKLALMNTSNIVMDPRTNGEVPYSPRVQGSGLMQIQNAINTPVIVTNRNAPLEQAGSVALKEIGQNTSFKLQMEALDAPKAKNNSDDIEYNVYVDVLKDKTELKEFDLDNDGKLDSKEYLTLTSERINDATVTVNDTIVTDKKGALVKIKPGQTKMLTVNVSLPDSLKKNSFVEGFVRLVPVAKDQDKAVPLTVPYMGFYGKWDEPQNIDLPAWEKDAFLGYTALWDGTSERYPKGYNSTTGTFDLNKIAISPNFHLIGIYSSFTALRNLQKTEMYIEDQSGNIVKYLGDFSEYTGQPWKFRKNIMSFGDTSYNELYAWDMKDESGQFVPEGNYQYVIKTTLDYPGARPQEVKMPVKVDSTLPKVTDIKVTPKDEKYEISWKGTDNENGSGYAASMVWVNGNYYTPGNATTLLLNSEPKSIVVVGADYAYNHSYTVWGDQDQKYMSEWMVLSNSSVYPTKNINKNTPAEIDYFAQNRSDWTFNVKDINGNIVDMFEFNNEKEVHTKWAPKPELPNGDYFISADVVSKDGFKVTTTPKKVTVLQQ